MVRNVKREKGFSFVEILVSMVILAIVVLVMTNVLVTSTKSHSGAVSEDVGDMLALQKLAELQNHVIPAKSNITGITTNKDNTDYTIKWEVDKPSPTSTTPPQAKVTVTWIATNGLEDTAQIVGYIDSDNACPDNGGGAPTGIKFIWGVDATTGDPLVLGAEVPRTPPLPAHTPIAYLVGEDVELAAGNDRVTIELTDDLSNKYYLRNDTLRNRVLIPAPTEDDLKFKITDCGGNFKEDIPFKVKIDGSNVPVIAPINLGSVAENESAKKEFTLTSTGGTGDITWSLSGAPSAITVETVSPASALSEAKLIIAVDGVNHEEVNGKARFTVIATDAGGKAGEALCSLIVTDDNDASTGITLSNTVITSSAGSGDVVGGLAAVDEDTDTQYRNHTFTVNDPKFKIETTKKVLQLNAPAASLSSPHDVTVTLHDGGYSVNETFSIIISSTINLCVSEFWNHGAEPYKAGDYVRYLHAGETWVYQAKEDIPREPAGMIAGNPKTATAQWKAIQICTP